MERVFAVVNNITNKLRNRLNKITCETVLLANFHCYEYMILQTQSDRDQNCDFLELEDQECFNDIMF